MELSPMKIRNPGIYGGRWKNREQREKKELYIVHDQYILGMSMDHIQIGCSLNHIRIFGSGYFRIRIYIRIRIKMYYYI